MIGFCLRLFRSIKAGVLHLHSQRCDDNKGKKKKVIVKKKLLMSSECYFHFSIIILNIVYLTLQFHLMFSFYRGDVSSPGYFHVAAVGV